MNDQLPPELFAERPVRSDFARSGLVRRGPSYAVRRFITLFIICVIIGSGLYWKFSKPSQTAPEQIPTIKADGNYKQRPEQPGGIDIPHQDVQVYQSLDAKGPPKEEIEHLLPPPETPESATIPPQAPKAVSADATPQIESLTPPAPKIETTATQATAIQTTVAIAATATPVPPVSPVSAAVPPTPSPVAPEPVKKTVATVAQPPQPNLSQVIKDVTTQTGASASSATTVGNGPTSSAPVLATGDTAIQLASIPDQASAQTAMNQLQTQYASLLGSTQLRLVKADLGSKGIYYRIQSQPVSEARAKSLCSALKANKAGCILVRH